jgi:hypothetical protein
MHNLYLVKIIIIIILSTDPYTATLVKELDIYPCKSIFAIPLPRLTMFCCISVACYNSSQNTTYEFCKTRKSNLCPAEILCSNNTLQKQRQLKLDMLVCILRLHQALDEQAQPCLGYGHPNVNPHGLLL